MKWYSWIAIIVVGIATGFALLNFHTVDTLLSEMIYGGLVYYILRKDYKLKQSKHA